MKLFKLAKSSFLIALTLMLSLVFLGTANAEEKEQTKDLSKANLQELNTTLDDMTKDVNKQLKEGKGEAKAIGYFEGEAFELSFSTNEPLVDNDLIQPMATRTKSFSVTLKNTAGFNFSHNLYADWTYNSSNKKISKVSPSSILKGAMYGKTHSTKASKQTNTVYNVHSTGTFKALKVLTEYKTHFHVRVNGTGTHQVVRASIG